MILDLKRPLVFLDLETTGTDIKESFIIEISMVKITPDGDSQPPIDCYVKPPISIPAGATKVNGITDETVKDALTFKEIAPAVLAFISGTDLVGFNSNRFDIPLLNNEFKRNGWQWEWKTHNFIDVGNIYKIREPRTLSAAYRFYTGEELEEAHKSLNDVFATMEVFNNQIKKFYPDYQEMSIEELAMVSNYGRNIVDISGFFGVNEEGEIIFNIGKHKGKLAKNEKSYLEWMLQPKNGFDHEVLKIVSNLLYTGMHKV